jgi:CheY-like chemotaxis protein
VTTTLLAVDDSVTMRKVLEITFAGEQFKTVLATSGQEALALLRSERPALVLVDHTLADTSGYDLCQQMKSALPGVAVLLLSSKQSPYDKARGQANGVDDFMDKPFDTQKLLDKVTQVLREPRAAAAAPAAPAQPAAAVARNRPQTLAYGTAAPAQAPSPAAPAAAPVNVSRTLPGTAPQQRAPAQERTGPPAPVAQVSPLARTTPAVVSNAVAAAASSGNGLSTKLESLGLSPEQVQAVLALSREVVEQVVWEVVPVLAETIIKEEIGRLTSE